MRLTTTSFMITAVLSVGLTACSGDESGGDAGPGAEAPSQPAQSPSDLPGDVELPCKAEVTLTGAVEASWSGEASVRVDGDSAVYSASKGSNRVVLYSADESGGASANVSSADASWATMANDPAGLDADASGRSATAEQLTIEPSGSGAAVTVDATFSCKKG